MLPSENRSHGAEVFACVGTCWGGYMVARLSGKFLDAITSLDWGYESEYVSQSVNFHFQSVSIRCYRI